MNIIKSKIPGRIIKQDYETRSHGLSIIGKLRIGEEKKPNAPGKAIDWFRATGAYAKQFHDTLGEHPNGIQIIFPSHMPSVVCNHRIEGRDKGGNLVAYFDGVDYRLYNDAVQQYNIVNDIEFEEAKKNGIFVTKGYGDRAKKENVKIETWKERLTIRFVVLKFKGIFGVWELSTSGVETGIPQITTVFDEMVRMAGHNINRVVFDLNVKFAVSNTPGNTKKYPVLSLIPNLSMESALQLKSYANAGTEFNMLLTDDNISKLKNDMLLVDGKNDTSVKQLHAINEDTEIQKNGKPEFSPENFKIWILKQSEKLPEKVNEKTVRELNIALSGIVEKDADRLKFLKYICNVKSSKELTMGSAMAIIKWISIRKDIETGMWIPERFETIEQYQQIMSHIGAL